MKRSNQLLLAVLCLAIPLFAKNSNQSKTVIGTVCNSACVVPQNNLSTCDTGCTDRSGDVVLVDDQGKVLKIANPNVATPHLKKRVKCTVVPSEKQREQALRIERLSEQ